MGIKQAMKRFIQEEEGATAVEYAVMIVLIVVAVIATVTIVGQKASNAFNNVSAAMGDVK